MKNLIGIITAFAFVFTVAFAFAPAKASQAVQASQMSDCHHQHADAEKTEHSEKETSHQCCEKGVCKCATGMCHGGLAKILNTSPDALVAGAESKRIFISAGGFLVSALPEGIKRPPRA